jgi:lanosterol synthase
MKEFTKLVDPQIVSALQRAVANLESLQNSDGSWEGEMDSGTWLLCQYILARRVVGPWPMAPEERARAVRGLVSAVLSDGSWPAHREGDGELFSTVLAYVALRLLGEQRHEPLITLTRGWIQARPGAALGTPAWGKFWLALLGLYEYEGLPPIPPEAFLSPRFIPLHPDRFFCITRQITVVMSRLYGQKFQFPLGDIAADLRIELYDRPYRSIDFAAFRRHSPDAVIAPPSLSRLAERLLGLYERHPVLRLRRKALDYTLSRVREEVVASQGHGASPMSALLDAVALAAAGDKDTAAAVLDAQRAWMWQDECGLRLAGFTSASWDTTFALHALKEASESVEVRSIEPGRRWLRAAQLRAELADGTNTARDFIRGGWCFSEGTHRLPVSDCTAEALSALLPYAPEPESEAIAFILARQNRDGGFGAFERRRGPDLLEKLNPSDLQLDCTVEKSYTECTASCIVALTRYRACRPHLAGPAIDRGVNRALGWLRTQQRADGSYEGFWGINFTYGTFFALEAFAEAGTHPSDPAISRAAHWLITHQKPDGGWGEHYSSLRKREYVEHNQSQSAMTAWALLALMRALPADHPAVTRGIHFLIQLSKDGKGTGWPQQSPSGACFRTAVLDYPLYKEVFPAWALARYCRQTREHCYEANVQEK